MLTFRRTHTHTHTHAHQISLSLSLSVSLSLTHTLSLSLTHTHTHTYTHTHTHTTSASAQEEISGHSGAVASLPSRSYKHPPHVQTQATSARSPGIQTAPLAPYSRPSAYTGYTTVNQEASIPIRGAQEAAKRIRHQEGSTPYSRYPPYSHDPGATAHADASVGHSESQQEATTRYHQGASIRYAPKEAMRFAPNESSTRQEGIATRHEQGDSIRYAPGHRPQSVPENSANRGAGRSEYKQTQPRQTKQTREFELLSVQTVTAQNDVQIANSRPRSWGEPVTWA